MALQALPRFHLTTLTLPRLMAANQALKTDGSGALGFASYLLLSETTNGQSITGGVRGSLLL